MPTAAELTVREELLPLGEVAAARGWILEIVTGTSFRLSMIAKDGSWVHFEVDCENYPAVPPAWHFLNKETGAFDLPADTPRGGGFFHSSGVICAPWNRLAYQSINPKGPHNDWNIGDWRRNAQTSGTKTLSAMALRLSVELAGQYQGRQG